MLPAAIPPDRSSRWALAEQIIERWFGAPATPMKPNVATDIAATEGRLGFALPDAIGEWHLGIGVRSDVWNLQDSLIPLDELNVEDGRLVLYRENQGVVEWGIQVPTQGLPDPPVFVFDPSSGYTQSITAQSVSEFALHMLALNVKFSSLALQRAEGQVTDEAIRAFEKHLPRLPVPDLPHWGSPTRLFGHETLVVEIANLGWLWITALDAESFALATRLAEEAGVQLDYPTWGG